MSLLLCIYFCMKTLLAYNSVIDLYTENLMTGYRVVFDREKLVLGWKKFDCKCCSRLCTFFSLMFSSITFFNHTLAAYAGYDIEDHHNFPIKPHSITTSPAVAAGLGNYTPKSTKETADSSQSSVAWPSFCSHISPLTCFRFLVILFLLL
jgi:hypothetical protein